MKVLSAPKSENKITQRLAVQSRHFLARFLILAGLFFATAGPIFASNHRPLAGWLPDQRVVFGSGKSFEPKFVKIVDPDGGLPPTTMVMLINSTFNSYSASQISVAPCTAGVDGCPQNGYKVTFLSTPSDAGDVTVRIGAKDSGNLMGYSSFTLRVDPAGTVFPASIGILPNQTVPFSSTDNHATYLTAFVIGDLADDGMTEDYSDIPITNFTASSSNHNVLLDSGSPLGHGITFTLMPMDAGTLAGAGNRSYILTAITEPGVTTGFTVVTVTLTDLSGFKTTTSFVLTVGSNAPPTITRAATQKRYVTSDLPVFNYIVSNDAGADLSDLKITANSSNTVLVPNNLMTNIVITPPGVNGAGSVAINPVLPLPSPGVPQTSTITLSVSDDVYNHQQTTFLYIAKPAAGAAATSFSRPSGVYFLSPATDLHRPFDFFLTGEMHGDDVTWDQMETGAPDVNGVDQYDFTPLYNAILNLPAGQDLSLNLQREPCYIAQQAAMTWCDTDLKRMPMCAEPCNPGENNYERAVPWDNYLRQRRDRFLKTLAANLTADQLAKISIINPNLPGGSNGIRNVSQDFDPGPMPGYTREALLGAIQDELRTVQDNFQGKLVQIGFFELTDGLGPMPGGNGTYTDELWQWLYKDASNSMDANGVHFVSLFDEFNGIRRPRVAFFRDDLGAARTPNPDALPSPSPFPRSNAPNYVTPPMTTASSFSPGRASVPSFDFYATNTSDTYNNGIAAQANTPWAAPYAADFGNKFDKVVNGSPNDGLENAFNAYLSQYLEVYRADLDEAVPQFPNPLTLNAVLWEGELHSWKDYTNDLRLLAPIEAPAGLSVVRNADGITNTVSWYEVYAPVDTTNPVRYTVDRKVGMNWTNVCNAITTRQCMDTASTGSSYAYRVIAAKGANVTPYGYVAGFVCESTNDGYVSSSATFPSATEPGIRAGQDVLGPQIKGILSFSTGTLNMGTVLTAKLRLKQFDTTNTDFDTLGECFVDIQKGNFGSSIGLDVGDFNSSDSNTGKKVAQIPRGPDTMPADWVETYMDANGISKVNTASMSRTQFRIYFNSLNGVSNTYLGWYSGGVASTPPQLIVQYTP